MQFFRLLVPLCLLLGSPAFAECTLQMSINQCLSTEALTPATNRQRAALARANTGTIDGSSGPISTSLIDFAPAFRLGLDSVDFGEDGNQGLTVDWNSLIRNLLTATFFDDDGVWNWAKQDHKLSLTINDAVLFEPLADMLTAEQKIDLEDQVKSTDDVTVSFSWSPVSERYGRRISSHSVAFRTLFNDAWGRSGADQYAQKSGEFMALLRGVYVEIGGDETDALEVIYGDVEDAPLQEIYDLCATDACKRKLLDTMRLLPAAGQLGVQMEASLQAELDGVSFSMLQKLVGNQPQWVAAVKYRHRDVLTGRDETSVKLSYEMGSYNMKDLYDHQQGCSSDALCINDFLQKNRAKIESGSRLSFSAEFVRKDGYNFMMTDFPEFNLSREKSLIASAAYGRSFDSSKFLGGAEFFTDKPAHLDIGLSYEDVDND